MQFLHNAVFEDKFRDNALPLSCIHGSTHVTGSGLSVRGTEHMQNAGSQWQPTAKQREDTTKRKKNKDYNEGLRAS